MKTVKLSPVIAFPLAATVNPFKGESHDLMVKVLKLRMGNEIFRF